MMPIDPTAVFKQPEYVCPIHGNVGNTAMNITIEGGGVTQHCLLCLRDLLTEVQLKQS